MRKLNNRHHSNFNNIEVWKLGGKSIKNSAHIRQITENVIPVFEAESNILVVSAKEGITRLLIRLLEAKNTGNKRDMDETLRLFNKIHRKVISDLFRNCENYTACMHTFDLLFKQLRNLVHSENFEYADLYASILQYGEILSSQILSMYLQKVGIRNQWFDPRLFIKTEGISSNAKIMIPESKNLISNGVMGLLEEHTTLVTAGFITQDLMSNKNTILDLDGSDISAAIITAGVKGRVTYLKDIDGISSKDDPMPGDTSHIYGYFEEDPYYKRFENKKAPVHIEAIRILSIDGNPTRIASYLRPNNYGTEIIYNVVQ